MNANKRFKFTNEVVKLFGDRAIMHGSSEGMYDGEDVEFTAFDIKLKDGTSLYYRIFAEPNGTYRLLERRHDLFSTDSPVEMAKEVYKGVVEMLRFRYESNNRTLTDLLQDFIYWENDALMSKSIADINDFARNPKKPENKVAAIANLERWHDCPDGFRWRVATNSAGSCDGVVIDPAGRERMKLEDLPRSACEVQILAGLKVLRKRWEEAPQPKPPLDQKRIASILGADSSEKVQGDPMSHYLRGKNRRERKGD